MRDIKFRGLSAKGAMVFGHLAEDLPKCWPLYRKKYRYRIEWYTESSGWEGIPVKNETVGQFTGLKDLLGADIYEGDIVKWSHHSDLVVETVFFSQLTCSFETETSCLGPDEFEVIGNIHQNPELINEAKS